MGIFSITTFPQDKESASSYKTGYLWRIWLAQDNGLKLIEGEIFEQNK